MLTSTLHRIVLTAITVALAPVTAMSASPAAAAPGPGCSGFDTVLHGQYTLIPLKNQAMLTKEHCGYRFRAGQQDSHLEVTEDDDGLLFHDSGTASWRSVEAPCEKVQVAKGVAAWCPVSGETTTVDPMLVEVWPRLGDDDVDASSLPARFQVAALLDAGDDTFLGGAGNDFVNGAADRDVVQGGDGDDWLRGGLGPDTVSGGPGNDKIVTQGGADVVDGGAGADSIYSGGGTDTVTSGDSEHDLANCGPSSDRLVSDQDDKRRSCEKVTTYAPVAAVRA